MKTSVLTPRQLDMLELIDRYINRLNSQQAATLHLDLVAPIRDKKISEIRRLANDLMDVLDEWETLQNNLNFYVISSNSNENIN